MHIAFHSSPGPSLGVELELELVDRATRELVSAASDILAELGVGHPGGTHPKAKHELFECTIEVITGVCATVAEARADLEATLAEVGAAARARNLFVLCAGTHPISDWRDQRISPDPRYATLVREMAWMAERLLIFGVHFHVGVRSPEKAVAIANALSDHLPLFLALSASSPYWHGHDTGLASSRSKVFEGLPTAGLPEQLVNWQEFEQFMATLVSSEAIGTIRDVWWDIRPHPDFGTVELRMCDGIPSLAEVTALAALAQCLVEWLDGRIDQDEPVVPLREWIIRQNKWRAARHGLDADLIVDERGACRPLRATVADLVEELGPTALRLGCAHELAGVLGILDDGASYQRQRAVVAEGGALTDVVDLLVGELGVDRLAPMVKPQPS
ncbi:glutamate--cysteine ligase [soil metagenome]